MRKKLIFSVLGLGILALLLKQIGEIKKVVTQNQSMAETWEWFTKVWVALCWMELLIQQPDFESDEWLNNFGKYLHKLTMQSRSFPVQQDSASRELLLQMAVTEGEINRSIGEKAQEEIKLAIKQMITECNYFFQHLDRLQEEQSRARVA